MKPPLIVFDLCMTVVFAGYLCICRYFREFPPAETPPFYLPSGVIAIGVAAALYLGMRFTSSRFMARILVNLLSQAIHKTRRHKPEDNYQGNNKE